MTTLVTKQTSGSSYKRDNHKHLKKMSVTFEEVFSWFEEELKHNPSIERIETHDKKTAKK
ncbi:hypothetical protein [Vibrio mediterranei]|uniref:hypothetical protein n=1 Tax=Vibrio TaxID=662 RepID=UPI004068F4F5